MEWSAAYLIGPTVSAFHAFYLMFIATLGQGTDKDVKAWERGMEFQKVFW